MKIFFWKNNHFGIWSFKNITRTLLVLLLACIFISQIARSLGDSAAEVSLPKASPNLREIKIYSSPLEDEDVVWVMTDGEKRIKIKDNKAQIVIDRSTTLEIMSETGKKFTVTLVAGDGVETFGETVNIQCRRGINYICRCVIV